MFWFCFSFKKIWCSKKKCLLNLIMENAFRKSWISVNLKLNQSNSNIPDNRKFCRAFFMVESSGVNCICIVRIVFVWTYCSCYKVFISKWFWRNCLHHESAIYETFFNIFYLVNSLFFEVFSSADCKYIW